MISDIEILDFLRNTKRTQANYQFIVIRELVNSGMNPMCQTKDKVFKALSEANNGKTFTMSNTPVFKVLTKKGMITSDDTKIVSMFDIQEKETIDLVNTELERILAL